MNRTRYTTYAKRDWQHPTRYWVIDRTTNLPAIDDEFTAKRDAERVAAQMNRDERAAALEAPRATDVPDHAVIELLSAYHGPRLGIVDNLPPRRVVAVVDHHRADGTLVAFDADGIRMVVPPTVRVKVLAARAEAGWRTL